MEIGLLVVDVQLLVIEGAQILYHQLGVVLVKDTNFCVFLVEVRVGGVVQEIFVFEAEKEDLKERTPYHLLGLFVFVGLQKLGDIHSLLVVVGEHVPEPITYLLDAVDVLSLQSQSSQTS